MGHNRETEIELYHRIGNILQLAVSFLRAEYNRAKDISARSALENASARIGALAEFNRQLARHSDMRIELHEFLQEIMTSLAASIDLTCVIEGEACVVDADTALKLARAVTELLINAKKHGYRGQTGGIVTVSLRRFEGDRLCIQVSDKGKGLDKCNASSNGLGLCIVNSIVKALKGELKMENREGATFLLVIPLQGAFDANTGLELLPKERNHSALI